MPNRYTRDLLFSLRPRRPFLVSAKICGLISALGRAGRHVRSRDCVYKETRDRSADTGERIPTIVGLRPTPRRPPVHADDRRRVLQTVRRTSSLPLTVGVFNARSVGHKSASIASWIGYEQLSLEAVVETWHDGHNSPSLIACTPDGYSFVKKARPRVSANMTTNHGGICLFYSSS